MGVVGGWSRHPNHVPRGKVSKRLYGPFGRETRPQRDTVDTRDQFRRRRDSYPNEKRRDGDREVASRVSVEVRGLEEVGGVGEE